MATRSTFRSASPWIGGLYFFLMIHAAQAEITPREFLIEVNSPVRLQVAPTGVLTNLPDLDAFIASYQQGMQGFNEDVEVNYALDVAAERHPLLQRYLLIRVDESALSHLRQSESQFLHKLSNLTSVTWAQPHHLLRCNSVPNDPFYGQQWGLMRVHAAAAWERTSGSAAIPIAIIDTGCEMEHPDLIPSFWTNSGEIPNNGIDDDGNGFVDDIRGWDFVDAPTFPSYGDYLVRDNDPNDELGHGTAVAGICGAAINNGIGVAGLAPNCPLMILRAGNADGFLQEDDVAAALLYALDNGARIANLSFGDTQVSPMLTEVVRYVTDHGLMLIAAAGNTGDEQLIYPAAYTETLCVGACTQTGARAPFSTYGTVLDLLAPGVEIISTVKGSTYGTFLGGNGTSYAAPFAAAAAGLVLSLHPQWAPTTVASVLKSTAEDVNLEGWDQESGAGLLQVDSAVEINDALVVEIAYPVMEQGFAALDTLEIRGTAAGAYLENFKLYAGIGMNPITWELIREVSGGQALSSVLAVWRNPEPIDSAYTLRLIATDIFGAEVEDRVLIYLDPSPPQISDVTVLPLLDGERPSFLLNFKTDDLTTGRVWLESLGGGGRSSLSLNYQAMEHTLLIGKNVQAREYAYYIVVLNTAGLQDSSAALGILDLRNPSIASNAFVPLPQLNVPLSSFYEEATDLNGDGYLELWVDTLDAYGARSNLRVYQATPGWGFADANLDFGKQIPKSIGDSDADGKAELLTLYGGVTKLFEATDADPFPQPNNVIWADSGDVWGVKLLDLNPNDGHGEVLLVEGGVFQLYAHSDGQLTLLQALPNPFGSALGSSPPYCRVADYDADGKTDLLFGDYSGHLYIYEQQETGSFAISWQDSLPYLDLGEFLSDGDYNGNGAIEFAALGHTQTAITGEHQADTRRWGLYIFKAIGDNQYARLDSAFFFGAENPSQFASGISSGDVFESSEPEILLCLYPDFYVLAWDAEAGKFEAVWYWDSCRSNRAVVGDFDRNGHGEFIFNSGTSMQRFEATGTWSFWPPPPQNFRVEPKPTRLTLKWTPVAGADTYNLYKGKTTTSADTMIEVDGYDSSYVDFAVLKDSTYYYAIATVDLASSGTPEGQPTNPLLAIPNDPPFVIGDTAHFIPPNYVSVQFNEPMGPSLIERSNYWLAVSLLEPQVVFSEAGDTRALLSFPPNSLSYGTQRLLISKLYDQQGSPFTTLNDTLYFNVYQTMGEPPYLTSVTPANSLQAITLGFSQSMISTELAAKNNYSITLDPLSGLTANPPIVILSAIPAQGDSSKTVVLNVASQTPLLSALYHVEVNNVRNTAGLLIDPLHNSIVMNLEERQTNNERVYAFPNPCQAPPNSAAYVIFDKLAQDSEVQIITLSGILIKTLNGSGSVQWDLTNERGNPVGSGIYLYYVKGDGGVFKGKLAVVR